VNRKIKVIIRAAAASAPVAILGAAPADAFFPGFPQQIRQDSPPAAALYDPRRSADRLLRRSSRPKPTEVAKVSKATTETAEKPKGPYQIIISLDRQHLTLYAGSKAIAQSRVSTGQPGHRTPTGVFSVIEKDRWHHSNLYGNAPMYFMQRITWSGVAMHQGIVPNSPASHGCIRLPDSFARQLWGITGIGARVIVAHGEPAPVEISHPLLFVPKREPAPVADIQALEAARAAWTLAELASKTPLLGASITDWPSTDVPMEAFPAIAARPHKEGPVSVFISRKEGKLFVRKGFEPLFDTPIAIENPGQPLGTYVFTAIAANPDDGSMRWTVVTAAPSGARSGPEAALDRITIPPATRDQISELMSPGASLIVSDQGLSRETGMGTDFIVLTR